MIPRDLLVIEEDDLLALVAAGVQEGPTIDFKREPPARTEAGRHDLCADVSAMANAVGGDIMIGMDEDGEGRASAIAPWVGNADEESRRLADVIANGIESKIHGLQLRPVPVTGGHVFVIRIPQSWIAPHRVRTNQHFFVREGSRRRQLDVPEIRSAFIRSAAFAEEIRSFRAERVGKIVAGEAPTRLMPGAITVLHIFPLGPQSSESPLNPIEYRPQDRRVPLIGGISGGFRINLDGALGYRPVGDQGSAAYTQLFRSGRIEAVRVFPNQHPQGGYNIPSSAYEVELMGFIREIVPEIERLRLGPPAVLAYSILRAKSARLGIDRMYALDDADGRFDRDVLLLPDVVVTEFTPIHTVLRPVFDLVWQSAGVPMSWNYDENGEWRAYR